MIVGRSIDSFCHRLELRSERLRLLRPPSMLMSPEVLSLAGGFLIFLELLSDHGSLGPFELLGSLSLESEILHLLVESGE